MVIRYRKSLFSGFFSALSLEYLSSFNIFTSFLVIRYLLWINSFPIIYTGLSVFFRIVNFNCPCMVIKNKNNNNDNTWSLNQWWMSWVDYFFLRSWSLMMILSRLFVWNVLFCCCCQHYQVNSFDDDDYLNGENNK